MTPVASLLHREIASGGPIPFDRFMEAALYHPEHGYYRSGRDVFGRGGDFYTAEQMQPVFGRLIARIVRGLWLEMGRPAGFQVVELGAGRGEMASAFSDFPYTPVEWGSPELPSRIQGVVFANEFFDALPVRVFRWRGQEYREMLVASDGETFSWVEGPEPDGRHAAYLASYAAPEEDDVLVETNLPALAWLDSLGERLEAGYLFAIDYGYTRREAIRFPQGTLMAYRRHTAGPDVLVEPGRVDVTAHVNFTALMEHSITAGFREPRFETLARSLLRAGEEDQFAGALRADTAVEDTRLRLQLKSLLFGMGETFRTLLLKAGCK